jgi:hypothetical protein
VGELGGHSHWIGIAAIGGVAALLALLPSRKRKQEKEVGASDATEGETEAGVEASA